MKSWLSTEELTFFHEQGYVIKRKVFDQEALKEIQQEYWTIWFNMLRDGQLVQNPKKPVDSLFYRMRDHHRKNDTIRQYAIHPTTIGIVEELIGEEPLVVQSTYYIKAPYSRGIPIHQDNYDMGITPGTTYSAWLSIDDSDAENGGLFLLTGTHKDGLLIPCMSNNNTINKWDNIYDLPEGYESINVVTEPGDMVFFDGNLLHGSYRNNSSHRLRQSFVVHFTGISVEKLSINYNYLLDKHGRRVRRKINMEPKAIATQGPLFTWQSNGFIRI